MRNRTLDMKEDIERIANSLVSSYKKKSVEDTNSFYRNFSKSEIGDLDICNNPKVRGSYSLNSERFFCETEQELHLAIKGNGYFQIKIPDGSNPEIAYARIGDFTKNDQGEIVTPQGFLLLPVTTIPANAQKIIIDADGTISAIIPNMTQPQILSQIVMSDFFNRDGLNSLDENLYAESEASGPPINGVATQGGFGELRQGWLENTNIEKELQVAKLTPSKGSNNPELVNLRKSLKIQDAIVSDNLKPFSSYQYFNKSRDNNLGKGSI